MNEKHIFKSFAYFYKIIYKTSLVPSYSETVEKTCSNFIELLKDKYQTTDRLGEDYLWFYFIFQFTYWSKLEVKSFNAKINLSMIVGKKAFDRYLNRQPEFDWQTIQDARTYDRKQFKNIVNLSHSKTYSLYDADEIYRKNHLNTDIGLSNCIIYTSLYNPNSINCQQCSHCNDCIMIQQQIYPHIYQNRTIENGQQTTTGL